MFKERKESGRRGEMMSLPFVFIISLIIGAVIIIFSIITIKSFTCRGEQVVINVFISDFKTQVEKAFYTTKGSQTIFRGTFPQRGCSDVKQVCIGFPDEARSAQFANDEIWFEISAYGADKNLFLYPRDGLQEVGVQQAYKIPLLNITQNPTCFQNTGQIEIMLKNEGKYVNALRRT